MHLPNNISYTTNVDFKQRIAVTFAFFLYTVQKTQNNLALHESRHGYELLKIFTLFPSYFLTELKA